MLRVSSLTSLKIALVDGDECTHEHPQGHFIRHFIQGIYVMVQVVHLILQGKQALGTHNLSFYQPFQRFLLQDLWKI